MKLMHPQQSRAKRPLLILLVTAVLASTMIPALADSGKVYPLAGDFNGDGVTTPGWFTNGVFVLYGATASGDTVRFRYGRPGDVPVAGDWTGDKRDTVGVVRNGRQWLLRDSNTPGDADRTFVYGGWLGRDRPVAGDWTGKGYDAPGIVRGSTWHLRTTLSAGNADITFTYGRVGRGDIPVAGDWTNKGRDTAGVVRDGVWHLRNTNRGGGADLVVSYGRDTDVPVVGNWDGRGGDTPGVVRGSKWMLKNTLSGGSADVTLDLLDPAVDAGPAEPKIVATKKPTTKPTPAIPPKPSQEPDLELEPELDAELELELELEPEGTPPTELEAPRDEQVVATEPDDRQSGVERLLYSDGEIAEYISRMSGAGPYYSRGDVTPNSPGDGARAVAQARRFLADPSASAWVQPVPMVPTTTRPIEPHGEVNQRFMQAAWVYMTEAAAVPEADRRAMRDEVKRLLLGIAQHPNHDYWDGSKWDVNYPGSVTNPFFAHAEWMVRLMKARDMLGRDAFSQAENQIWDQWLHGYANYAFRWFHVEGTNISAKTDARLSRDYSNPGPKYSEDSSEGYDGSGPRMRGAGDYSNRHATVVMAGSLAANYIKHFDYVPSRLPKVPSYGVSTVDQLLDQSRLFNEELLTASWYPVGMQHDFGRGSSGSPTTGWSYSMNVANTSLLSALYHAKRGDMSLWEFATTKGFRSSAGSPAARGGGSLFAEKSLHHMTWSMVRYVNDAWGRRLAGQKMVPSDTYHDVLPAALAGRFAPQDTTIAAAWRRQGQGFPAYPSSPRSQGPWHAHDGQGAQWIGLIEHGAMPALR
jgi:hypothetical protein